MSSMAAQIGLDEPLDRRHWRWGVLSSLADYIDAGSIVAGAAALALWQEAFGISNLLVGLLAAFSSNAISCGIGALIGGRLGDLFGRKRIYSLDLLVYCFGTLWIIFAADTWMLFVGYIIVGLAVGADVPTSWSLISEFSPRASRAKLMGLTNIFWYIGPIVTIALSLVLAPLGLLGMRLLFVHLFIVAIVTWWLRRKLVESPRWTAEFGQEPTEGAGSTPQETRTTAGLNAATYRATRPRSRVRDLLRAPHRRNLAFLMVIFTLWNIPAGTFGFFLPYILTNAGSQGTLISNGMQGLWFASAILTVALVFMPYGDRVSRKWLYGVSAAMQTVPFVLLAIFPLSSVTLLLIAILMYGLGQGAGQWPLLRVWSVELFPTMLRNTAQGMCFGTIRICLGIWSLFVAVMLSTIGFHAMAWILAAMMAVTLIVGVVYGPDSQGQSLEEIQDNQLRSYGRRPSPAE